jgi:hypothetical protein
MKTRIRNDASRCVRFSESELCLEKLLSLLLILFSSQSKEIQKFNRNDEERAQRTRRAKGNSGMRRKIRREGKRGEAGTGRDVRQEERTAINNIS